MNLVYEDLKEIELLESYETKKDEEWSFKNRIEVRNVTYHYPDSEVNVIENASFCIEKGKMVAFIGASGAGKSTMVDILLGLLPPQSGRIYLRR